jgi:hypothetical protein
MRTKSVVIIAALALSAPLAACATSGPSGYATAGVAPAYGGAGAHENDGLLPEPPADAKAGQCFAKVVVPGQPVYGPPAGPHLTWVQSPPQPGTIGPVWCQVWEQGYQPTVSYTPERYGWIRVICDKDATKDKIDHIQHRLHDWGYYQGGYGGEYDQATAEAVKRFQSERHIEHGGYLSYKTMELLDAAPPQPVAQPSVTYAQGYGAAYSYAPQGYSQGSPCGPAPCQPPIGYQPQMTYQPPVYQSPCGPQPCQAPPPCGPAPCQNGYGQGGYGGQWGGGQGGNVRGRAYLTWAGKSAY